MKQVSLFLLFFFAQFCFGQDFVVPEQKIVGVDNVVPLGELVSLSVANFDKSKYEYLKSTSYEWKIFDGNKEKFFAVDAKGNVFLGAGIQPKTFLVIVAVTHLYIKENTVATKTVILTANLKIGDEQPPNPNPNPNPTPPDLPDGKFGLSKFVYNSAGKIDKNILASSANKLANSFDGIAAAIVAGTIKTPQDILKKTKESNDNALIGVVDKWEAFSDELENKLFELYNGGKLKSVTDYADAWKEIAIGLRAL